MAQQYVDAYGGDVTPAAWRAGSVSEHDLAVQRSIALANRSESIGGYVSGAKFPVEITGTGGWERAETLPDGTQVLKNSEGLRMIEQRSGGGAAPQVPGYEVSGSRTYRSVDGEDIFYSPAAAAQDATDTYAGNMDARDIRGSFGYQSLLSRGLADAEASRALDARIASGPFLAPIDTAAEARAAIEKQRTINNLAGGLGGPFVASPMQMARMAGLNENQVQEAGVLGMAVQDAFGAKGSGSMSAMARSPKGPTTMMDYLGGMSRSDRMAAGLRLESVQGTLDTYSMYGGNYATQVYMRAFDANGKLLPGSVRLDGVGRRFDGGYDLIDNKLSGNAPFTKNQEVHYPAFEQYGGLVTGRRGGIIGLPKGTVLPPTPVDVLRGPMPVYRQPN